MALTREVFASARTESFAEAFRTALDDTNLFDEVTRTTLVVTATIDNVDILTIDFDKTADQVFMTWKNGDETWSRDFAWGDWRIGSSFNSYTSINTNGNFVYCVFTNSNPDVGYELIRYFTLGIFKTDKDDVALTFTGTNDPYAAAGVIYPPTYVGLMATSSLEDDFSKTAFILPKSYNKGWLESYPLTVLTKYGSYDKLSGVYGLVCAPALYSPTRSVAGVMLPLIVIDAVQYITDGVLLIDVSE